MQARFNFNGSEEIEVWNGGGQVMVTFSNYPPLLASSDHPAEPKKEILYQKCFTKSQARSLASSMMQAAAEA